MSNSGPSLNCGVLNTSQARAEVTPADSVSALPARQSVFFLQGLTATTLAALGIFGWAYWKLARIWDSSSDFEAHYNWVREFVERGQLLPHPIYHLLCVLAWKATGTSLTTACYVTIPVVMCVVTAGLIFWALFRSVSHRKLRDTAWLAAAAVGLTLVAPLNIWSWPHLYMGFLTPTVYHNPTYLVLKPLALLLFVSITMPFQRANVHGRISFLCLVSGACVLAKPNYVLALIPALPAFWFCSPRDDRTTVGRAEVLAVIVPAVSVLLWQYMRSYQSTSEETKSSVVFAPFVVAHFFSDKLLLRFLCSIAFPLAVAVVYGRHAWLYAPLRLAWLSFAVAVLMFYMLAETGRRLHHGNFVWGANVCSFILFVASTMFLLTRNRESAASCGSVDLGLKTCWGIWGAHLVAGLVFYAGTVCSKSWADVLFVSP